MARDHARINLAIWNDDDFLDLPPSAQHLYLVLWTHPDLSYAGVVDWRPARLAQRSRGWSTEDVVLAGKCLEARLFIVIDEETEECLVRSFFRFDGLLKQPIMAVSFANARAAVSSRDIRGVIVHEARKLHAMKPDLAGWLKPQVQELLSKDPVDPKARALPEDPLTPGLTLSLTPATTPGLTLNPGVGVNPSPKTPSTPSPSPSPTPTPQLSACAPADADAPQQASKPPRRKPSKLMPEDWKPNDAHREQARKRGVSAAFEGERFRNWVKANDRRYVDWDAAFRNWLMKATPTGHARQPPTPRVASYNRRADGRQPDQMSW
jgi:hypothetical protein